MISNVVAGIPINKEKKIPCFIFLFVPVMSCLEYKLDTTGKRDWEIARVKKDGNNKIGRT